MKTIVLQKMTLSNFRGIKELTITFNGKETTICGGNGTGKSTVFNSFLWLLFGKDAQDRKDFNIQPTIDGIPERRVDCSVEAVLLVDGEEIKLRRVLKPNWVKPSGKVDQVFKGNVTETYWNETPVNVTEYTKRIAAIIDDSVFKMLTNPMSFANMKWQQQREQLFLLAGTSSDEEIAAGNESFLALLDRISGKSFADYKKEISALKKRLKDDLAAIDPKIKQTYKLMPEKTDFDAIEATIASLDAKIADIDNRIADHAAAIRGQYQAIQDKNRELNDLKTKRTQALYTEQMRANEAANRANEERRNVESKIKATEREVELLKRSVNLSARELENEKAKLESKRKDIEQMRASWFNVNAEEYEMAYDGIACPLIAEHVCKNPDLMARLKVMQEAARDKFNQGKAERLANITQNGVDLSNYCKQLEQDIANTQKDLENAQNALQTKRDELVSLNKQIATIQVAVPEQVKPEDVQECVNLTGEIKAMEAEIAKMGIEDNVDATTDLQNEKKEYTVQRDNAQKELCQRGRIEECKMEIAELETKGKELAQQIADVEREEYTIQEFSKARIDECERRINGLFTMVKFKLFDYTIADAKQENPIECCIPLVNGVPFQVVNTAGQFNAGLDIINTLCKFYNVNAPIFIDGRESVNKIIPTESQIINLVVSNDKNLQIK